MKTPINTIVRCVGGYESKPEPKTRQPWRCVVRAAIDPVAEYDQFWQDAIDDNSAVNSWYDQKLKESGTETMIEETLNDRSAWDAKLAQMDAQWSELDAQRAAENAALIEHAEQTQRELLANLGYLAAIPRSR